MDWLNKVLAALLLPSAFLQMTIVGSIPVVWKKFNPVYDILF